MREANRLKDARSPPISSGTPVPGAPDKIGTPARRQAGRLRGSLTRSTRHEPSVLSSRKERSRTMTTLHDQIHALRAELTSFHLSRRERTQIERELKEALARRDTEAPV